jgi:Flp pilus assembly protein TadG
MPDLVDTARRHQQRGAVAIEFMLVMSMIVVVFLIMLQYTVRAHAHRIATAAAEEGLAAASAYDGSAEDGRRTAQGYLHRLGPGLHGTAVSATRSATIAHVAVTGEAEQLLPFLTVRVSAEVEGPVERFVEDSP